MQISGRDHRRSALVLYGTETGNSQDLAEETARTLQRLRFHVDVASCDDATHKDVLSYDLTVFLISTTGQGDFPTNARRFWASLLRKRLPATLLSGVSFAMVGLCDTSYLKFNYAARKLGKRLQQLGAEEIIEACEADEQGDDGTDGAFLTWLERFRSVILARYPLPTGTEAMSDSEELPSQFSLQRAVPNGGDEEREIGNLEMNGQYQPVQFMADSFPVTIVLNDRVTPQSHWQDVRLLRLTTPFEVQYLPGDALAVVPENMQNDVATLIDLMGWHDVADADLVVQRNSDRATTGPLQVPPIPFAPEYHRFTLRTLLTRYLDINAIPRRSFFTSVARYTADSMHKERLLEFTEPQYLDEYYDYATRPRRSIIEVLQEFSSVKIPWHEVINVFPTLKPRQFSLASGGGAEKSTNGTVFELLVAVVKYKTVIKRIREGICTRYLAQLPVGTNIRVALRTEGRFFPAGQLAHNNHLLIGAGTGIAPLRALVQEKSSREHQKSPTALVFGARSRNADFFFSDEWDSLSNRKSENHSDLELYTAFSRDQKQKVYVQDRIRQHKDRMRSLLLDPNTVVIVCGASGAMPKAVRQALTDVLSSETSSAPINPNGSGSDSTSMTSVQAEAFLKQLEKEGKYKQETWS